MSHPPRKDDDVPFYTLEEMEKMLVWLKRAGVSREEIDQWMKRVFLSKWLRANPPDHDD
jgi:hypothetical protein